MKAYRSAAHLFLCSAPAVFTSPSSASVCVRAVALQIIMVESVQNGLFARCPKVMDVERSPMSDSNTTAKQSELGGAKMGKRV